ncbi:hypothetical protein Ahy_B03g067087 isoform F [Arachis hypogaea]|uniref:Uncharacterized protein n=1 Tax=Arachis hypogaea TaxID=3818 RepID=A0A445A5M9_ARAHY|nr:hypothetical protein Ahy_B03g067087 isoform F [Arachis hypogaea]
MRAGMGWVASIPLGSHGIDCYHRIMMFVDSSFLNLNLCEVQIVERRRLMMSGYVRRALSCRNFFMLWSSARQGFDTTHIIRSPINTQIFDNNRDLSVPAANFIIESRRSFAKGRRLNPSQMSNCDDYENLDVDQMPKENECIEELLSPVCIILLRILMKFFFHKKGQLS